MAVSYTHLDVYKRQIILVAGKIIRRNFWMGCRIIRKEMQSCILRKMLQRRLTEGRHNEMVINRSSRMARHRSCRHTDRTLADRRIARMGVVVIYRENRKNATPLQTRRITCLLYTSRSDEGHCERTVYSEYDRCNRMSILAR